MTDVFYLKRTPLNADVYACISQPVLIIHVSSIVSYPCFSHPKIMFRESVMKLALENTLRSWHQT